MLYAAFCVLYIGNSPLMSINAVLKPDGVNNGVGAELLASISPVHRTDYVSG